MIFDLQKASMWKRISAWLLDAILLCIIATLMAFLLSTALNYDSYEARLEARYAHFEAEYGVTRNLTQAQVDAMSPEERANLEAASKAIAEDEEALYAWNMMLQLMILITSFGILSAYLLLEILIPVWLKNGQTLGKKIFGIAVMRADGVRLSLFQLLVRTVLGKYTVETMLPIFLLLLLVFNLMPLVSVVGIAMILIIQLILLVSTTLRTPIHDMIAGTVTVDLASQMIFENTEELIEYKKRLHAEQVKESPVE